MYRIRVSEIIINHTIKKIVNTQKRIRQEWPLPPLYIRHLPRICNKGHKQKLDEKKIGIVIRKSPNIDATVCGWYGLVTVGKKIENHWNG